MKKLSAIVLTYNEKENIRRCLKSLMFADEVVVVDSGSTDETVKYAKELRAKVFGRKFDNFSSQRNYAISKTSGEWILSMDADEEIPFSLGEEIKNTLKDPDSDAYLIPRRNIIFGREIKHARWSPDKHIWLFKKNKGKFENDVHEEVEVDGKIGELKNAKLHYSHKNIKSFIDKLNKYTDFESEQIVAKGENYSFLKMVYEAKKSFIGRYILKLGFLDGWHGFVLSYLRAMYKIVIFVKVWEKTHK